jgi:hypothetical protein
MLSLEEVKKKTAELLGKDESQLGYITQELLDRQSSSNVLDARGADKSVTNLVVYGHNVRYGAVYIGDQTYQCYWFESGPTAPATNPEWACRNDATHYALMDYFDHNYLGNCQYDNTEAWQFVSR